MKNNYSEQELIEITKNYIKEFSKALNIEQDLTNLPISVNKRLNYCLGRYRCSFEKSINIELSHRLLYGVCSREDVLEIIKHEVIHYLVYELGYKQEIHGEIFKKYCKILGCKLDGARGIVEEKCEIDAPYKYKLTCTKCNYIWYKNRSSKVTKYPERFKCNCGGKIILDIQ